MTITAITEKKISIETNLAELLAKVLSQSDTQRQHIEMLRAENKELRQRVEKLEQAKNRKQIG